MQKQKTFKPLALNQILQENFNLNTSQSSSGLNLSSSYNKNISHTFNSNKIGLINSYDQSLLNLDSMNRQKSAIKRKKSSKLPSQLQHSPSTTLIKSKQILQKVTSKLSSFPYNTNINKNSQNISSPYIPFINNRTSAVKQNSALNLSQQTSILPIQAIKTQIYETTNQISKKIQKKLQTNFAKLLNRQTVMPIAQIISKEIEALQQGIDMDENKQNSNGQNGLSLAEGTKLLMTQYWQQKKKNMVQTPNKKSKNTQDKNPRAIFYQSSNLPKINQKAYNTILSRNNQSPNIILGKISKNQKKRQQMLKTKDQQLKLEFYSFVVDVIDYKIQNQSKQFLLFQRINFKKWEDINFILLCIEAFCKKYQINQSKVNLKKVLQLLEIGQKRAKIIDAFRAQQQTRNTLKDKKNQNQLSSDIQYTTHQILNCFEDPQKISQTHPHSKGIRFFGNKGKKRAIIKIQSHFRRYLSRKRFQTLKKFVLKVILIQRKYRSYLQHSRTKQKIMENQLQKISKFNSIQKQFKQNYRKNELTKKIKYEIHICSLSSTEWQRVTTQNIDQRQNTQLSRIFRIATKTTPLIQTRIIYIAPNQLPKDIVNYYRKIFQFGSNQDNNVNQVGKLNIIWPQNVQKLPQTLSLTQKLLYSKSTMKRLKRLVRGNYCYIVPSMPSNDYINLCYQLNVPLYSAQPQKLLYLQSKAGSKQFVDKTLKNQKQEDSFGILPYSMNIYNKTSLINELTFLILHYPSVRRWILKIDNQNNSRGLAYIDISKILKPSILQKIIQPEAIKQKSLRQQIYNRLHETIITFKQQKIIPLSKQIYHSQQQYLNHFLANGGIIQASINNFQTQLQNHCFVIQIEPDFEWKFLSSYYKITNKNKTVGCYYDSANQMQPPIQIQIMVNELIKRNLFGFFTFEFLKIPSNNHQNNSFSSTNISIKKTSNDNLTYFNGIQCHLNDLSSASFLKEFLSKDTNVLYIPFLTHPSLKQLRIQTFFHLCRLQNISFDIQRKIGNVFMFLNGLQSGCMGLMSFNSSSKKESFQQVSDVLQFLSSKLCQSSDMVKKLPKSFMSVRNVINGYLKKQRNSALKKEIKSGNSSKSMNNLLKSIKGQDKFM